MYDRILMNINFDLFPMLVFKWHGLTFVLTIIAKANTRNNLLTYLLHHILWEYTRFFCILHEIGRKLSTNFFTCSSSSCPINLYFKSLILFWSRHSIAIRIFNIKATVKPVLIRSLKILVRWLTISFISLLWSVISPIHLTWILLQIVLVKKGSLNFNINNSIVHIYC